MPDALPPFSQSDEALARELDRARLTGDPLGHAIAILVGTARHVTGTGANFLAELRDAVTEIREPVPAEDRKEIGRALAKEGARALAWMHAWAVGGALVLTAAAFFALGWWLCSAQPVVTPLGPMPRDAAEALARCDFGKAWEAASQKPAVTPAIGGRGRWVWCWEALPSVR